jgi:hypothetical protein
MGYRGKVVEQARARDLRAAGRTVPDIAAELGVSRSSVSLWVRDVPLPAPLRRRVGHRGPNALQRRKAAEIAAADEAGRSRMGDLSDRDLLVAGTALYAGEGAKADGSVKFANSDPRMIRLFLRWLRTFFEIDETRLRGWLYLHEGLDVEKAIRHWSEITGIPPNQFGKPYRAVPDPSIRRAKHEMGCLTVAYSCSRTHREVMGLMRALLA